MYHSNLLAEKKRVLDSGSIDGVSFLDVLIMTYVTSHVSIALYLFRDNSLSFSVLSVWHCTWEAAFCRPRLACFLVWARGALTEDRRAGGSSRSIFPTLSFLSQHCVLTVFLPPRSPVHSGSGFLVPSGQGRAKASLLFYDCSPITPTHFKILPPLNSRKLIE